MWQCSCVWGIPLYTNRYLPPDWTIQTVRLYSAVWVLVLQVAVFPALCGVIVRMTVGICQMKLAARRVLNLAGRRLRSSGESKTLQKGEWQFAQDFFGMWSRCFSQTDLCGPSRINVLNSNLEGVVLDNRYYAGSCLPQYIQDVRFRKPYNLQQYTLEARMGHTLQMLYIICYQWFTSFFFVLYL